jgi:hypothetical protein
MSRSATSTVRDIRRGVEGDAIEFTLEDGRVLITHCHGVHADEKLRTREALLQVLLKSFPGGPRS